MIFIPTSGRDKLINYTPFAQMNRINLFSRNLIFTQHTIHNLLQILTKIFFNLTMRLFNYAWHWQWSHLYLMQFVQVLQIDFSNMLSEFRTMSGACLIFICISNCSECCFILFRCQLWVLWRNDSKIEWEAVWQFCLFLCLENKLMWQISIQISNETRKWVQSTCINRRDAEYTQ